MVSQPFSCEKSLIAVRSSKCFLPGFSPLLAPDIFIRCFIWISQDVVFSLRIPPNSYVNKKWSGWWLGHPSEKYALIGMIIPNIWENKPPSDNCSLIFLEQTHLNILFQLPPAPRTYRLVKQLTPRSNGIYVSNRIHASCILIYVGLCIHTHRCLCMRYLSIYWLIHAVSTTIDLHMRNYVFHIIYIYTYIYTYINMKHLTDT